MDNYLIPANTKKGQLILNIFRPFDLWIVAIGAVLTTILLLILEDTSLTIALIKLLPIAISLLLVMPVPQYHNVYVFISEVINYYINPTKYLWRGWCATYVNDDDEKSKKDYR